MANRNAPIQMPNSPHGVRMRIPWRIHLKAWQEYGKHYSQGPERLAERGGFGLVELIYLLAGEDPYNIKFDDDPMLTDFFNRFTAEKPTPPVVHGYGHTSENQDMEGIHACLCGRTFDSRDMAQHLKENQTTVG